MNKLSIEKKISIIVFAVSILGLGSGLISYSNYTSSHTSYALINALNSLIAPLRLAFFNFNLFEFNDFDSSIHINFFQVIMYSTLLIGGILYIVRKQVESRLIRFFFSLVFISNILYLLSTIFFALKFHTIEFYWTLLTIIPHSIWIYLSYWILTNINKTKTLDNLTTSSDDSGSNFFLEASNWQRFFHLIIDTIFCILILSVFAGIIGENFLEKLVSTTGEKTALYILFFIFRLIYYPFWETLFGATPAKFLTETRVINQDGTRIGFSKALLRTLSRFIPFEPFSFFGSEGWHDSITKTLVVSEKRTGVYGGRYFLIIPLFLIFGLAGYFGHEAYKDHESYVYRKTYYDRNTGEIEKALKDLSTDHLIKIREAGGYSSNNPYLKIEKIKGDNVLVSVIPEDKNYNSNQLLYVQEYYKSYQNTLTRVVIKKSILTLAYTKSYDDHKANHSMSANLLNDGKNYEIESIDLLYASKMEDGSSSSMSNNNINLSIKNTGWSANLIEIKNLEGSIKWLNTLPQKVEGYRNYNDISLYGENYKHGQKYKVKLVVEDSLKRKQTYILEGKNLNRTLIKEN